MEFELSSTSKKNKKKKHKKNKKQSSDSVDKCAGPLNLFLTSLNIVRDYVAKGNVHSDWFGV